MSKGRAFLSAFTPSLMAPEDLEAIFVQKQRHELADRILHELRESVSTPAKHHTLLVGPRGIGKTHLIALLYHRIRSRPENADLDGRLRIAWLKEEERGVRSFGHLVRRILEALAAEYCDDELKRRIEALLDAPQDFEARAEQLLTDWLADDKLLILAENFDDLLRRIGLSGQQNLRAHLQNVGNTILLVTTPSLTDELSAHEAPFYGFFNVENLLELQEQEAADLLQKIAEWRQDLDLLAFLKTPTARNRLRVIEALAGGHPRIWILFAGVLTRDTLDELAPLFLEMLDDLTPYYQARLDTLSPQQAQIVECLIEKRRSVPVWEIARYCLMEPNSASVQLRLLGEMGYVRNDRLGRVSYYELREPLMRLCLEVKSSRGKPLQIVVDFLRRWYDRGELEKRLLLCRPDSRYERMHMEAALAQSPQSLTLGDALQQRFQVWELCRNGQFSKALALSQELIQGRGEAEDWYAYGYCLQQLRRHIEAVESYDRALEIDPKSVYAWNGRGNALRDLNRSQEALASYDRALEIDPENLPTLFSKVELYLVIGAWGRCLDALQQGFEKADQTITRGMWENHGQYMCRGLLRRSEEYLLWRERVATLTELYWRHGVLGEIGMGIVRTIPDLFAPTITDVVADAWNAAWQAAGKGRDELVIPLRLLDAAVRWRASRDPAVLLSLPAEERPILEELLSLENRHG